MHRFLGLLLRTWDRATLSLLERVYLFEDRLCAITMALEARVISQNQADRLWGLIVRGYVPRHRSIARPVVAHSPPEYSNAQQHSEARANAA